MSYTESTLMALGTTAPPFSLLNVETNAFLSLDELTSEKATLIMFICNHCPYVKYINTQLVDLAKTYQEKGVSVIAISSNDAENYPDDSPEKMKEVVAQERYTFPYLYDESQEVARAYDAACTPDFYVFDGEMKLAYRGRIDDSRPGNDKPQTGADLRAALDAVLEGLPVSERQYPSGGCNIKWKKN